MEFGADDFCKTCQVCTNACPPGAIMEKKQMVRGVERWYVDFDKCIPYFVETCRASKTVAISMAFGKSQMRSIESVGLKLRRASVRAVCRTLI